MLIKQRNNQRLNPLVHVPSLVKKRVVPARYVSEHFSRYKTEGNEPNQPIFPLKMNVERHHSVSERNNKKELMFAKRQQLGKEQDRQNFRIKSGDISMPLKKQSLFDLQTFEQKIVKKPFFTKKVDNLKIKDLQCNIVHLLTIFQTLLKKKDHRVLIACIKKYILEEESDLNELQLCLQNVNDQNDVKSIILYERLSLVLLVESLINKRYRFNEQYFTQLFKQLLSFYSFIYFQLTQKSIDKLIQIHQLKTVLTHLPQKNFIVDINVVKSNLAKRVILVAKQFTEFDKFIAKQNAQLKNHPSNLLYYNLLEFYAGKLVGNDWNGWGIQFLETCPSPYVHYPTEHKYTVLLDLDETLVHYRSTTANRGQFLVRPNLFSFLSKIQPYFELGIFTCALQSYADLMIQHMPMISIRLYRQHAIKVGKELVKDLSRVGRDLSRVILVDNLEKNFQLQKQNGIHVRSWFGDANDDILESLGDQLVELAQKAPRDVRKSNHKRSFL